ncbi:hypothetical protein ASA1KI_18370 [Opitutales bacterium ASA1]|uniref:glycoside hydrolase family 88/105 protein n=1 Tax=Congregicoccus parvus TaxID=3081749 RepID=UPI002B2BF93D|nr:hypothetical protein ASA1KI_18370 [Opitutales bacterium ASA1]
MLRSDFNGPKTQPTMTFPRFSRSKLLGLALGVAITPVCASTYDPGPWPAGKSPEEVGRLVTERYLATFTHQNVGRTSPVVFIIYPEVCTWYGALTFAAEAGAADLRAGLVRRFEPLLRPVRWEGHPAADERGRLDERHLVPAPDHVDNTVFAAVPFEIYIQTGDERCLKLGRTLADWQWSGPDYGFPFEHPVFEKYFPNRVTDESRAWLEKGYTWQTRLWIDDMYMITAAQAQAYRATGERKYIERAAREMVLYLDELQRANGLFHHAPGVPYFWGRGNGWMAAGSAELLRSVPEDDPHRPAILAGYRKMMATLLELQGENGMWNQLLDDPESWPETSGTAMVAFAFITGVKHGWLDAATYGPAARKAWLALTDYVTPEGNITDVCEGTNIHNPNNRTHGADGRAYYNARRRLTGDWHGQAPMLWSATAWLRE